MHLGFFLHFMEIVKSIPLFNFKIKLTQLLCTKRKEFP